MKDMAATLLDQLSRIESEQDRLDYLEAKLQQVFDQGKNNGVIETYNEVEFALSNVAQTQVH